MPRWCARLRSTDTSLLPGLFAAVQRNTSRGNDDLALFEAGRVFFAREAGAAAPMPSVLERPSDEAIAALFAALPDQPRRLACVLAGVFAPWLAHTDPVMDANLMNAEIPPGSEFWFGTDAQGRVQFDMPWSGTYVAEISHKDATPGERQGAAGAATRVLNRMWNAY